MSEPMPGATVPEDWIGTTVLVLSHTTGETLLPEGGYSFVGEVYSGAAASSGPSTPSASPWR
jgi:hypothetical protein